MASAAIDQAGQPAGDFFQLRLELFLCGGLEQLASQCQFQQADVFLDLASGDPENVLAVGLGEAAMALGDRHRRAVQLVNETIVAAGELLVSDTDFVGEIDQLLTDDKYLEGECHDAQGRERG